jgi:hypothetical protein
VVKIDVEITLGLDSDIEKTMAAEAVQHMIEKRHAGIDPGLTVAVQLQSDVDIGFLGLARNFCGS